MTKAERALTLDGRIAIGRCGKGLDERCETGAALQAQTLVNDELARGSRGQ